MGSFFRFRCFEIISAATPVGFLSSSGSFCCGRDMCANLAGESPVVGLIGPRPSLRQAVHREV